MILEIFNTNVRTKMLKLKLAFLKKVWLYKIFVNVYSLGLGRLLWEDQNKYI